MDQLNPAPPSVGVVISAFSMDRLEDILEAAHALEMQTSPPDETVIVVDANARLFAELRNQLAASPLGVVFVFNEQDKGLSHSRNTGILASKSTVVAFLDDDAVPSETWVAELRADFKDTKIAAVAGWIDPLWKDPAMDWFPRALYWMISCTHSADTSRREIRNGFGANMAFRRTVFETTGLFREDLGLKPGQWIGGEDTEMFIRARRTGKVIFNPRLQVQHKILPSRLTRASLKKRAKGAGKSMAVARRMLQQQPEGTYLREESSYLKQLLLRELPREFLSWARSGSVKEWRRPGSIVAVVWWTGVAFFRETARPTVAG